MTTPAEIAKRIIVRGEVRPRTRTSRVYWASDETVSLPEPVDDGAAWHATSPVTWDRNDGRAMLLHERSARTWYLLIKDTEKD
jgi:hypothetical protein